MNDLLLEGLCIEGPAACDIAHGGKRDRFLFSQLLFIMTGWVLLSPQEDGVGTLWTDLSLSNPGCFIGSCKAQTGSLRMASFSEERRLCGNRGIRVE